MLNYIRRQLRSGRGSVPVFGLVLTTALGGARLQPEAEAAWKTYVVATERRIASEQGRTDGFLALDFAPDAAAERRAILAGSVVIRSAESTGADGNAIEIPSALAHHWRGAVFIPGATVDEVMSRMQNGSLITQQEDVRRSAILDRAPGHLKVFLELQRTKIVTVVYVTEHDVTFSQLSPTRAVSRSVATKIAQVDDANTPSAHERPPGDDSGYLWKLNAYWRYEQVPGGVIAECESISLSRSVPMLFRIFASSIIEGTARESMDRTLVALRALLTTRTSAAASGADRVPPGTSPAR